MFRFLTIYSGIFLIALIVILPETLRTIDGNGSIPPKGLAKSPIGCDPEILFTKEGSPW